MIFFAIQLSLSLSTCLYFCYDCNNVFILKKKNNNKLPVNPLFYDYDFLPKFGTDFFFFFLLRTPTTPTHRLCRIQSPIRCKKKKIKARHAIKTDTENFR